MDLTQKTRLLARKQKRLNYLRDSFKSSSIDAEDKTEISALLDTYAMLLSKIATSKETESEEAGRHLDKVERELNSIFENFRLRTSNLYDSADR